MLVQELAEKPSPCCFDGKQRSNHFMDIHGWKLAELKRRTKRAGAHNIETREITDNKVIKRLHEKADRLLIDAPCSGLGVLKRNPDSKWKIDQDFIDRIRKEQETILQDYSKIIKKVEKWFTPLVLSCQVKTMNRLKIS